MQKLSRSILILFVLSTIWLISEPAAAQDTKSPRKMLFYTYAGPIGGFGYNHIKYKDWNTTLNEHVSIKTHGFQATGGAMFNVFIKNVIGDFRVEYIFNHNGGDHVVHHLFWSIFGKYRWQLTDLISIATGGGIYFETPPSNLTYSGTAGLQVPVGIIINTTFETRLVIDLVGRFGLYGYDDAVGKIEISDNSYKASYGITVAFLFKVGRL